MSGYTIEQKLQNARDFIEMASFDPAIKLLQEVFIEAVKTKDYASAIQSLADEVNAWRHLHDYAETEEQAKFFAHQAFGTADIAIDLVFENDEDEAMLKKLGLVSYRLATACMLHGFYDQAVSALKEALGAFNGSESERLVWEAHLVEARFYAKELGAEEAIGEINSIMERFWKTKVDVDVFLFNVWHSGLLITQAKILLVSGKPGEASEKLQQVRDIVEENDREPGFRKMAIRRRQMEKFFAEVKKQLE